VALLLTWSSRWAADHVALAEDVVGVYDFGDGCGGFGVAGECAVVVVLVVALVAEVPGVVGAVGVASGLFGCVTHRISPFLMAL
jgi:hypothetical protein